MKGPYWILQADVQRPDEQAPTTKYIAYDKESGGYPWWPDNFSSAHLHLQKERATEEVQRMIKANPVSYNGGPSDAFKSICLPAGLSTMFGGQVNTDGLYQARLRVIKLSGDSVADMKIEVVSEITMKALQYSKVPNKQPEITWTENVK